LDNDAQRFQLAIKDGHRAVAYNPGDVESYKKLHLDFSKQVNAFLCLREDDVQNVYATLTIRSIDMNVKIMSLLMNNVNRKKLIYSGVNEILYDKEFVGLVAREYIGQPVAFEAIHALRMEESNIKIEELLVTERIALDTVTVGELHNTDYRLVLLGIHKKSTGRFYFNPIASTLLEPGDVLLIIGNYMFIREFTKYLSSKEKKAKVR